MALTRILNNQVTDSSAGNTYLGINAGTKVQDYSVTAGKLANNLTYASNLTVQGNLDVQGTTTTIDTYNVVIEDPLLLLAKDQTGSPSFDIGFIGERGSSDNIAFAWIESADEFATIFTNTAVSNTTVNVVSYANFHTFDANVAGNLTVGGTTSIGNITIGNISVTGIITADGNITGGNLNSNAGITGTTLTTTGTATVGNVSTAGTVNATGNITGGNVNSNGTITGTTITTTETGTFGNVSTAGTVDATGNISGGNLNSNGTVTGTTLTTTGTATVGNLSTAGTVSATGNITGGNVTANGNVTSTTAVITPSITTASGDLTLNSASGVLQWDGSGNIVMNNQWINNLGSPTQSTDAATKQYVDDAVSTGITIHTPVRLETPTALPAATYAQGGTTATVTDTLAGNTVVFSSAISPQVNDQYWFTNSFNGVVGNIPYFVVSAPNTSAAVLSTTYNGVPVSNITTGGSLTQAVRINSGQSATLTGNANGALTVDSVSVSAADRILVYNQTPAYENGVYVVSQTGNATAPFILTRSTDANTYIPGSINGLDAGDYFYVQEGSSGAGESYVMTAPTGPIIIGYDSLTFTQFSASQVYSANTSAGLSLSGTVFSAKVDNDTTAFDGGGNISVKAGANLVTPNIGAATGTSLNVTGNIDGANIVASANVIGVGAVFSGNVTAANFIGNISGNIDAAGANTQVQFNDTGDILGASANFTFDKATNLMTVGNISTGGTINATGNISGGNLTSNGSATVTTTATVGNLSTAGTINATGNVSGGNLNSNGVLTVTSTGTLGNLVVSGTGNITGKTIIGNVLLNSANTANAALAVGASTSVLIAVGNTSQRPDVGVTGMLRFNTTTDSLEYYDNDSWTSAGTTFTVIVADSFVGNGVANTFTLSQTSTTAGTIVSINGIVQIPTTSYSVSGNVLTFTEAPEVSDAIDARLLTTTTTVTSLSSGSATIEGDGSNAFVLTGNFLNGNANGSGNIGSPTGYFNTIFATATSAQYADLAEMYEADQNIEPGTVVCFGGAKEVTMCGTDACRRIAGVISTNPSYIMNAGLAGDYVVAVALTGRVPTRVTGTIRKGDMLVATTDGRARAEANPVTGSIIGKALADFDGADGVIEVVVGRL